ncbi:SMC1, partial [Symbiodinium sp. KB8]
MAFGRSTVAFLVATFGGMTQAVRNVANISSAVLDTDPTHVNGLGFECYCTTVSSEKDCPDTGAAASRPNQPDMHRFYNPEAGTCCLLLEYDRRTGYMKQEGKPSTPPAGFEKQSGLAKCSSDTRSFPKRRCCHVLAGYDDESAPVISFYVLKATVVTKINNKGEVSKIKPRVTKDYVAGGKDEKEHQPIGWQDVWKFLDEMKKMDKLPNMECLAESIDEMLHDERHRSSNCEARGPAPRGLDGRSKTERSCGRPLRCHFAASRFKKVEEVVLDNFKSYEGSRWTFHEGRLKTAFRRMPCNRSKHLRARGLRPQVITRLCIVLAGWPTWLDPLHDSVLDEALADTGLPAASSTEEAATGSMDDGAADEGADGASDAGSALSTLTTALEAADRSPSVDRGPGPHGPPPAVPVSHPLAWLYAPDLVSAISVRPPALPHVTTRTSHGQRPAETTTAGSSSSARGPPSAPHMPGEPDDPYWQRVMAVNVMNTLQHTGPAFVHAPTLATVRSWSSLRIILEEATEMDEVCCQRVDPQDLNNPLHMDDLPGTGEDADTENGEEEDGPAAEEGEEESNHSPDDDHDEEPDGHGPAGTPTTGAATTPGGTAPNGTAAPTDDSAGPAPGDPLHMIHSITDATASRHAFSTRPGDWVYEAEAVSFNLSAAHRCLEQTRRNVVALRKGNRH